MLSSGNSVNTTLQYDTRRAHTQSQLYLLSYCYFFRSEMRFLLRLDHDTRNRNFPSECRPFPFICSAHNIIIYKYIQTQLYIPSCTGRAGITPANRLFKHYAHRRPSGLAEFLRQRAAVRTHMGNLFRPHRITSYYNNNIIASPSSAPFVFYGRGSWQHTYICTADPSSYSNCTRTVLHIIILCRMGTTQQYNGHFATTDYNNI